MTRARRHRYRGAGLVFAMSVLACRQIVGIEDRAPDAAPACGELGFSSTCQACLSTKCCAQGKACGESTACNRYETCNGKCGADVSCRARCIIDTKWTADEATYAFGACISNNCGDACGLPCGQGPFMIEPFAASDCEKCGGAKSCPGYLACYSSPDCQRLVWCRAGCRSPDCVQACEDPSLKGADLLQGEIKAIQACWADCKIGEYWSCAGTIALLNTESASIHVTATVSNAEVAAKSPGTGGIAGVTVTACRETNPDCGADPVLARSLPSDGAGKVAFDIPTGKAGAPGFAGSFLLAGGGIFPSFAYLPTLTRSKFFLNALVLNESQLATLGIFMGVTKLDPERGQLAVVASDCLLANAPEVEISATGAGDPATKWAYLAGAVPSLAAKMTDATGSAVFLNMPLGPTEVTIRPKRLGTVTGRRTVLIQKGTLTVLQLGPT